MSHGPQHFESNDCQGNRKERVVVSCVESRSTSCGTNRTRFLAVQTTIRVKMQCDKESFLAVADE
jgi:hypothetical protein